MEPAVWLTLLGVFVAGAVSPGPSLAVVLKNTVEGGRGRGVACALGHGLGVGLYALVAVAGLRALVEAIRTPVTVVGALYLAWLGLRALAPRPSPPEGEGPTVERASVGLRGRRGFVEGFLFAFLNPKVALFFLALLSGLVPAEAGPVERAGVALMALVVDAGWYALVAAALVGSGADRWLRANGAWVDRAFGLVLLGLGGWLLVRTLVG